MGVRRGAYNLVASPEAPGEELNADDGKDDELKEAEHGDRADWWDGANQRQHHNLHSLHMHRCIQLTIRNSTKFRKV